MHLDKKINRVFFSQSERNTTWKIAANRESAACNSPEFEAAKNIGRTSCWKNSSVSFKSHRTRLEQ